MIQVVIKMNDCSTFHAHVNCHYWVFWSHPQISVLKYEHLWGVGRRLSVWRCCSCTYWRGVYIKAPTETTETPPCSPPADQELSDCSSVKRASYLSHAHWGITYDVERVTMTSSREVHRLQSFLFFFLTDFNADLMSIDLFQYCSLSRHWSICSFSVCHPC